MNIVTAAENRHAVIWLLLAQLCAILPLIAVLPPWVVLVWLGAAWWYWRILSAGRSYPNPLLKAALALVAVAGVYLSFSSLLALEAMVAILVLALILKLLELKTERDHWLILMLSYFVVACGLLLSQQIIDVALALIQLAMLLMAQQAMSRDKTRPGIMLRKIAVIALQSLPLMLMLFVIFPRIGPLWTMPLPGGQGVTGMSDSLEFGDIAKLSQSGDLAFRVRFDGEPPNTELLYWRGLVLDEFDGRRWSRNSWPARDKTKAPLVEEPSINYTVTLESGMHEWLYVLPLGKVENRSDVYYTHQHQWLSRRGINGRVEYRAESNYSSVLMDDRGADKQNLRLVGASKNPQASALAKTWLQEYSNPSERVAAAMRYFETTPFEYTLTPAVLGDNNVDDFLFNTRQGYCEHFAGSFVYLMRAAGVPARIVVGYQGGELNEREGYLLVHQSDAHAWAEVWFEDRGWVRIDPTATVAPSRISLGAEALLSRQRGYLNDSPMSLRRYEWAKQFRYFVDNINYAWARWVLNFDSDIQNSFLRGLLGQINPQRMLIAVMLVGGLPLVVAAFFSLRLPAKRGEDLAARYYLYSCRALARRGIDRAEGETPEDFLARVAVEQPCWAQWFTLQTQLFTRCSYLPVDSESYKYNLLQLKQLQRPRKWMQQSADEELRD
ncbi:Protein-glutamine gamma-glutamyltransferase [Zhongshania aliphaticivorans]|uniref:Protein-glutamine gamma-glutamyltransferase n=1 Tax=Zhongshania aliphaticivorans TaxID=1470434 RepID=A0A5S9QP89_9GAMM|nr:Protein-glutamine gamma-glutamyltransferase [Zhongshania aliphaticivorans]CAA0115699.1 Protein-glutamine gamma-glutamyltransferase [Zhongshania aliphaticivorans]CAA0120284.1 Protein-glutamine gamma-glutamyltransferase [Zhongshania aliphaticivorans]